MLKETISDSTSKRATSESSKVQAFMSGIGNSVRGMADDYRNNPYFPGGDVARLTSYSKASGIDILTVGYSDNRAYTNDLLVEGWDQGVAPESYKPAESFWFKDARNADGVIYTEIYVDTTTNTTMVSVAEKIPNGALIADITLDRLNTIVDSIDIEGANAFILDQNTSVLASNHPEIETTTTLSDQRTFQELANQIVSNKSLQTEYTLISGEKALFAQKITIGNISWYLAIELDKSIAFASLIDARNFAIISTLFALVISIAIYSLVLNYVYRPIPVLRETIKGLSEGQIDLTQRLDVKGNDDLTQISKGVNQFIINFQAMMKDIQQASKQMQENVTQLSQRSAENADYLQKHVCETEQVVAAIDELNSAAESMASDINYTAQITQQANDTSIQSQQNVESAQSIVESLISEVSTSSENVQLMNSETENINSILNVIGGIAEQTNLLALNAAIEAARAGEQGRGFAVVADEVRSLASRTKESTSEVESVLASLISKSNNVVDSMNTTKSRCEDTAINASEVAESLVTMNNFVDKINSLSSQIATAAEQQSSVTNEVSSNMAAIGNIVTKVEANGKEALDDVEDIRKINQRLVNIVGRFTI
ncbi:methyl-accepting chemotaxis protein [Vibrio hannami]|uniref:methyl-accepting chemotaxis protein n=1 Tax=Vibrio hannami TaxID=2717094 RepID=UPI00240FC848|nr:methyl-accepting chemotaxis protein [Vibrio hannami]MDG3088130.1 methyl-accepting chemotaxis protein [Vibrio hannami]